VDRIKTNIYVWIWAAMSLLIGVSGRSAELLSERALAEKLKLYGSISSLEADFKQIKTLKDMNLQLKSEGHLKLQRPDHVVWEITYPSLVNVSLDKNQVVIRTGAGSEAQVQSFKTSDLRSDQASKGLTALITWLHLESKALAEQYDIYATGQQSFLFKPKQKNSTPFESLEMGLGSSGQLKHLTIHELSGDSLDIEFGKPKLTFK
jgi:outer membrane lipoprotein-sorting protein